MKHIINSSEIYEENEVKEREAKMQTIIKEDLLKNTRQEREAKMQTIIKEDLLKNIKNVKSRDDLAKE